MPYDVIVSKASAPPPAPYSPGTKAGKAKLSLLGNRG
jgi:hypothetical protein